MSCASSAEAISSTVGTWWKYPQLDALRKFFTISGIAVSATKKKLVILGRHPSQLESFAKFCLEGFVWKLVSQIILWGKISPTETEATFQPEVWVWLVSFTCSSPFSPGGDALLWNHTFVSEDKLAFVKASWCWELLVSEHVTSSKEWIWIAIGPGIFEDDANINIRHESFNFNSYCTSTRSHVASCTIGNDTLKLLIFTHIAPSGKVTWLAGKSLRLSEMYRLINLYMVLAVPAMFVYCFTMSCFFTLDPSKAMIHHQFLPIDPTIPSPKNL